MVTMQHFVFDSLPSNLGASEMAAGCSSDLTGGRMVEVGRKDLISAATQEAIEEIVRMERRLFPKHESMAANFHHELRKHNAGLLYCRAADGHLAGYVMYSFPSSLFASITKLAVNEGHRKQGYGEALVKAAIGKCRSRKIQRVSLHVDPMRLPAVSLYRKLGFQVDTLIEGYYSPHRDAYRMFLDINDW